MAGDDKVQMFRNRLTTALQTMNDWDATAHALEPFVIADLDDLRTIYKWAYEQPRPSHVDDALASIRKLVI